MKRGRRKGGSLKDFFAVHWPGFFQFFDGVFFFAWGGRIVILLEGVGDKIDAFLLLRTTLTISSDWRWFFDLNRSVLELPNQT
jgi:hypothetical protein